MIEKIINVKIFCGIEENELVQISTARLQQDLINKGYRLAGDTLTKEERNSLKRNKWNKMLK